MGCPVLGFFQLVLGVYLKLTPDTVNKSLRASEVFLEESLELWPCDRSGAFVAVLVLSSSEADGITEEGGGKKGTIHPCGAWGFKIIFTLLTKMIAIHMRFSRVGFRGSSFKWALPWLQLVPSLNHPHKHFHEFGKEVLGGRENKGWSRGLQRGRSLNKSLIASGVGSFCWALSAGEFIQLSSRINRSVDIRAPISTRS